MNSFLCECCLLLSLSFYVVWSSAKGTVSSAAEFHNNEFNNWLLANGVKGAKAPGQRLALVDVSQKDNPSLGYGTDMLELEGGRGVFATSNVQPGDVLLTVPVAAMLGLDKNGGPLPYPNASEEAALAALLLREMAKGEESKFSPYLEMLPKHVPVPWLTLTPQEYKELQFPEAVEAAESRRGELEEIKKRMDPAMTGNATAAEIEWASAIVASRVFWLPVKEGKGRMNITEMLEEGKEYPPTRAVLMPFGDMLNFHPMINHVTWDERVFANRIELVAKDHIQQNTEVYEPHVGRSVVELFVECGILSDLEMFDSLQLFPSLEAAVEWYDQTFSACPHKTPKDTRLCRQDLVQRAQDTIDAAIRVEDELNDAVGSMTDEEERYQFALTVGSCLDHGLATAFAVFWSVTARQGRSKEHLSYAGLEGPMGFARAHGLATLRLRTEEFLRGFATTEQEDVALLISLKQKSDGSGGDSVKKMSPGMELAIKFRLGVKRRLSALVEDVVGLLDGNIGFAERLQEEEAV